LPGENEGGWQPPVDIEEDDLDSTAIYFDGGLCANCRGKIARALAECKGVAGFVFVDEEIEVRFDGQVVDEIDISDHVEKHLGREPTECGWGM
jgi:copper chaperone CopZ